MLTPIERGLMLPGAGDGCSMPGDSCAPTRQALSESEDAVEAAEAGDSVAVAEAVAGEEAMRWHEVEAVVVKDYVTLDKVGGRMRAKALDSVSGF